MIVDSKSSSFGELLTTNICPTDAQVDAVRSALARPLECLSSLDSKIQSLESTLAELRAEKLSLQSYIDAHNSILSPTRRLPPEIVAAIFTYTLPHDHFPTRSSKASPLLLGRVCSQWRAVSLSTPELWNRMHIVIPSSADSGLLCQVLTKRVEYVATWLSRAGALPISFSLYSYNWTQHAPFQEDRVIMSNILRSLMSSLFGLSKRWQRVEFKVPGILWKILREYVTKLTAADVPMLESLKVDFNTWGIADMTESELFHNMVESTPLRSVSFTGLCSKVSGMSLDWKHLQHLQLTSKFNDRFMNIPEVQNVLSQCHELRSCDIGVLVSATPSPPSLDLPSVIALPHLRDLQLSLTCPNAPLSNLLPSFFQSLSLPVLSSLSVSFEGKYSPVNRLPFFPLLAPGHNVEKLMLHSSVLPLDPLIEVLEACPDLKTLKIEQPPPSFRGRAEGTLGEGLVMRLIGAGVHEMSHASENGNGAAGPALDPLCPSLEVIHLSNLDAKDELLLQFARSRTRASKGLTQPQPNLHPNSIPNPVPKTTPLKVFHVRLPRYRQWFDIYARAEELKNQTGLDIQLVHSTEGADGAGDGQETTAS
ncbi:hypothetical protein D9758_007306 [Tetrapyrgos nigripes]|uniref:F-box domain-containing protein n=1 Tax=Tetrapyrgos nigripes TaxID=182062 RepID=A0A8H5LLM1_9AGAR|nr:hypothetical protein D9758_007306 [Tetrapyrgos nigripes]